MLNLARFRELALCVLFWCSSFYATSYGQVSYNLFGADQVSSCDRIALTNVFLNTGNTLDGLIVTQQLPHSGFAYVTNRTRILLPGGTILSNAAAEPVSNTGSNLVWDFSSVSSSSTLSTVLISEVFYDPTNAPEDAHEWIEIYNPLTIPVLLDNWSIRDTLPGQTDILPTFTINPGEFVIIAATTNAFFAANPGYTGRVVQVADGTLGSGLNNFADGVLLRNDLGVTQDAVSYGGSTTAFSPAAPLVAQGQSLRRTPVNTDSNTRNDWAAGVPNPGSGELQFGLTGGSGITLIYEIEIACGSPAGQINALASYNQPAGGAAQQAGTAIFITVNPGDLTITKTPNLQDAGVGDTVVWTVTVKNEGFGNAPNVSLRDLIGGGLEFTSFSVNPTNAPPYGQSVVWDASVIPALTNLAPQQEVTVVVTALMTACTGLFNTADAQWGCQGMLAVSNGICEDTDLNGETAGASIRLIDRYPFLVASMSPASPIPVSYCTGSVITLTVSNSASGANAGQARDIRFIPTLPAGYTLTGPSIDTNGFVVLGSLNPGAATNVSFILLPGGACPLSEAVQSLFLQGAYTDACGNPFASAIVNASTRLVDVPGASVVKVMPAGASSTSGSFPVTVLYYYTNLISTTVTIMDQYPVSPDLTPTNVTAGGVLNTLLNRITWTPTLNGSGIFTGRFDILIRDTCDLVGYYAANTIVASNLVDCLGCTRPVAGSGLTYYTEITRGTNCPTGPGGTGTCTYVAAKVVTPALTEVCAPAILTHTFSGFTGPSLPPDWTGVVFTSLLANGSGTLSSTGSVQVTINGSNVTAFVAITATAPALTIDLSGLNASAFPQPASVTGALAFSWGVVSTNIGRMTDTSTLTVLPCGTQYDVVTWDVGRSEMDITLEAVLSAEACGIITGRIDLAQFTSPPGPVNGIFPDYDVQVILDLDAEASGTSSFSYVTGSTVYTGFTNLAGTAVASAEPTISSNQLIWTIGDVRSNGVGYLTYRLRASCDRESGEKQAARVLFNSLCQDGAAPTRRVDSSTNNVPLVLTANLSYQLKPEILFVQNSTQVFFQLEFLNSGAATAYNVQPEFIKPTGMEFLSSTIPAATSTATNVVWTLQANGPVGDLVDADGDGAFDDLAPGGTFAILVLNSVTNCLESTVRLRATHGCKGSSCQVPLDDVSEFVPLLGSLVTRTEFPAAAQLCATNTARYDVRNSGLTVDRVVQVDQVLPPGMSYVSNSARYVVGLVTNSAGNPSLVGSTLTFTQTNVPPFEVLQPGDEISILYDVYVSCAAVGGDNTFVARGRFVDVCGNLVTNLESQSVMPVQEPLLNLTKEALNQDGLQTNFISGTLVADPGDRVVYRLTIQHDALSDAPVLAMDLADTLPPEVRFDGASLPPDATNFPGGLVQLVWSNSTLMALAGGSPWSDASTSNVTILVTGTVTNCTSAALNVADLRYGCDPNCLSKSDSTAHTLSSEINLQIAGSSSLTLGACGGTRVLVVTNLGSTASGLIITNVAPSGYLFHSASLTGEFNSAAVTLFLTGTPVGSTALIDLSTAASSGATDVEDDAANGLNVLDLGYRDGFTVTMNLRSDGTGLDCLADPTDLDFADPDPVNTGSRTTTSYLSMANPCGDPSLVSGSSSDLPDLPDPDIDLQPNSVIVTNGQVVTFTATVRNIAEQGNADNLHIRLRFGTGWTNLTLVSSNIVSSGTSALTYEQQGHTNVLVTLPGVILDPVDDQVVLTFTAQAVQGPGSFFARAEVVGVCTDPNIVPGCTFTNTLGEAPLANTMTGSVINAVNGRYYGFDQDQTFGAGYSLEKTVRYRTEPAPGSATRTARIGEDLTYRIRAEYFGATFSNVVVNESLPTNLVFGVPVDAGSSANVSNWTWDAGTGAFTLPSPITSNALFVVDIPVIARNSFTNQGEAGNQTIITNLVDSVFTVNGVTNDPPSSGTFVPVLEPNLFVVKSVSVGTNVVQSGDVIVFSNVIQHTGLSLTNAYDVFFTDTLPAGLTFGGLDLQTDGRDNDGDGATDEADEGTLVSGNTITVTTNNNANLFLLATNQSFTVVFPALVTNQIVGTVVTNISQIQWTSLPGFGTNGNERTGADGTNGLNNYVTTGAVPLRYEAVRSIAKTVLSTSQTNTVDVGTTNQLTIGERIVYRIRVEKPQGVSSPFTITDLVPPGLDWVGTNPDSSLAFPGRGYSFTLPNPNILLPTNAPGLTITDPDPTPASSTSNDGSGDDIVFNFGTVTNVADGDLTNDFFLLDMEFVLLSEAANDGTGPTFSTASNRVQVTDGAVTLTATSPVYQVVDFDIGTVKAVSPNTFDAGDTLTISVVVSNRPFNLSRVQAYDVLATDFLPNSLYSTSTASIVSVPDGWDADFVGSATGLLYRLFTTNDSALAIGQAVTGRFTIAAGPNVNPNLRATNQVRAIADTIYGSTPTGIVSRGDSVTNTAVLAVTNLSFSKALEATSETGPADSTSTNVQVGEIVTYRLTVRLPEVTVTNLVITDDLPVGMSYILDSARADTNGFNGTLGALTVDAPIGAPGTLAPNSSNVTIRFAGASTVEGDNDTNNNSFAVFIDAIVLNTNSVNGLLGAQTRLTNSATLTYTGNPSNAVPSGVVVTPVIEPVLAITKTITNTLVDAGDRITVTLVLTNSGLATAYNLEARDPLNPLYFDASTVTNTLLPTGYVFAVETNTVVIRADTNSAPATNTLEVGESLTVAFDVTISSNLPPNTIFTNVAQISYADSISGVKTIDQQRVYGPTQSVDVLSSPNLNLAKVLVGTSETGPVDTTGTNVTIGEVVTYRLTVTVPEGSITNLAVTDDLPVGMTFFTNVTVDTTGFGGTLPGAATISNAGGSGGNVSFTWNGLTIVDGDNNPANNSFTITFDALVLDVAANDGIPAAVDGDGQTILTNRGSVTYAGNPSNAVPSGVVNVRVVEPSLRIDKTMTGPSNRLVVLSLTVTNRGLATAFDVVVTDLVSTVWFDTATLTPVSVPTGFTYAASGAPGNATVTFASDPLSGQPTNSIEVGESLVFQFSALLIPGASGRITNTAVVATNTTTDGPNPDERVEPRTNSTAFLNLPSFTVTKTRTSPLGRPADVGEAVTFRLTVTNTGAVGFSSVSLTDTYDSVYLAFSNATPAESTASAGLLTWANVGPLPVGSATNVFVTFRALTSTLPGDTTNTVVASLVTTNGGPLPPQTSSAPVAVARPSYVLSKERIEPSGVATQGQAVVFRLSVTNDGEVGLSPVRLDDTFDPAILSYVSATPAENATVIGSATWNNVGPLAVGGTAVVTVRFTAVSSTWPFDTTNIVVATVSTTNGTPLAPQTSSAPAIVANPQIGLTKLAGNAPDGGVHHTNAGADVVYTYIVTNSGNTHLVSMTITDNVLGVIGTLPGPLAPGATDFLLYTSSIPTAVTNIGFVVGTPSDGGGTPIPGLPLVRDDDDAIVRIFASLGDFVWLDVNANGFQDGGSETGLPSVVVNLYGPATNLIDTTATDANGFYSFTNLVPGTYFVGFEAPPGLVLTAQDLGGDTVDSDASTVTGYTIPTDLESGEYDPTWDAGLYIPASLGNFVWLDANRNGTQDGGSETGIPDVVVNLLSNGTVIATTTTDVNGAYAFTNLAPGSYAVRFTPPTGFEVTLRDSGGDTADSDADLVTGETIVTTLLSGENDPTWDAGLFQRASLGDFVWLDVDRNGQQNGGSETGIPDVVVNLLSNGLVIATTTTDVNGAYAFTNLVPATYAVEFVPPPGFEITLQDNAGDGVDSDADPVTGRTIETTLVSGENDLTWDAGLFQRSGLGNFVWLDRNGDGVQSGGSETGIPDVVVNLLSNGLVIATTTTDVNGAYAFNDLVPGDYAVEFVPPPGFSVSPRDLGGDDTLDSDADPVTGRTIVTTLVTGEFDPTWDAGLYIPASLGNLVWLDANGDGVQSGGSETGIPGVVVNLLTNGTVIATTTTDVNGAYAFTNLRPNEYAVEFVPPTGYQVTVRDEGGDDTADSDPDRVTGRTIVTTLESGEDDPTWDAGLYLPASLGNFVWLDVNGDGVQSGGSETGIPSVVVNLLSNGIVMATTTTDVNGAYAFTNLIPGAYAVEFEPPTGFTITQPDLGGNDALDSDADPVTGRTISTVLVSGENDPTWDAGLYIPASLGNFVWLDANGDGVQSGGSETGIPSVVVNLLSNGTVIATTTTDVTGVYAFTNLPPGDYAVEFQPPPGFELSFRDVGGNNDADSDPDRTTGRTVVTTLISGENDPSWDAGLFQRASLGNYVWLDENLNGEQDGTEPAVSNVVVNLYDINDVVIATTTTDVNGAYAFTNLVPDSYYVGFVLPPNYQFTTPNLGGDDTQDSDANQSSGLTTGTILLSGDNDLTWDAGLYQPRPGIQLIKVAGDAADGDVEYILPGEDVEYRYTIINTGNTYLSSITVTDDVLGVVGTITGPMAPGASSVLTTTAFNVTADVTNIAYVVGTPVDQFGTTLPFLELVRDDDPAIVDVVSPGYTLAKNRLSPTGRAAQVGEGVDFEITLVNTGDVTLVTVPVVDTYETAYLTFTGAVPPTVDVSNDGQLDWVNVGPVPAGASTTLVVRFVAAASSLGLDRTNTVVASPTVPPTVPPVFPKTNEAPYDVSQAGYLLTKIRTAPVDSARIGDAVTFEITIVNTGDVAFVTLPVTDRYETVYLTYDSAVPVTDDNTNDGEIVWSDVGPLPVGASTTLVVNFIAAGSSAGLDRTNVVTTWPTTPPDEPPVPPSTSQAPYRVSISGYLLTKTRLSPTNRPAVVEENVVFELTVQNTGDVALATVPLEDVYETAYLAFSNAVPPVDDDTNDGVLNWTDVGPVAPGASTSVVVTFQAIASSDGLDRTNTVTAAPTVPPGEPPVFPKTNEAPYAARFGWLGDTVWVDLDSDGQPDENLNAQGLNGIAVRLYRIVNGTTNLVDSTTTSSSGGQRGYYLFTNLVLGLYQVEVDLTTVPSNLDVITTARRINAELTPNGFFINADFGFIAARPTEVSLMYFRGAPAEGGVSLTWATASERENLGYHLYRADSADGPPQRITADLIPGAGTGEGRAYQWLDTAAEAGEIHYYWLEDVEYDGDTTRHGPVRVNLGEEQLPGVPFLVEAGGVYVVTAQTLADAGLPVYSINADELTLTMNGEPAALFTPAEKRALRKGEAVLVYVPEDGADLVFGIGPGGLRMESVYAGPSWDDGETWLGVAEQGRALAFTAQPGFVRYLLADFEGIDAWVLDISRSRQPRLLIGMETIQTAQGTGFYLSYPVTKDADCIAVTPQAMQELTTEQLKR